MTTPSSFQRQFPLSGKKFWKKLLPKCTMFFILASPLALGTGALIGFLGFHSNSLTPFVLATLLSLVLFFLLFVAAYSLYIDAYIKRYYYDSDAQFLTIRKGVFTPKEIHVPFNRIQDVYVDQDLLDRILGIYDVHIASATYSSGVEAHIDGVDGSVAEPLKTLLLNRIRFDNGAMQTQPMAAMGSVGGVAQAAQPTLTISAPEKGKFTSQTFPIDGRWTVAAFFTNLLRAVYSVFFLYIIFVSRSRNSNLVNEISPLFVVLAFIIIFLAYFISAMIWQAYFSFEFTDQYILVREGFISRSEKHVPYRTIQDVQLNQGFVDRILGLSNVVIENAAAYGTSKQGGSKIVLPGQALPNGNALVAELNRIVRGSSPQSSGL